MTTSEQVSHLVSGLYDCEELPDRILAISPAGDMTLLTTGLELKTSHPASAEDNRVISVHIFSQSSSSFLKLNSEGAVVVLLVEYGDSIQVEVYSIDTDDAITSVVLHKVSITNKVQMLCHHLLTVFNSMPGYRDGFM